MRLQSQGVAFEKQWQSMDKSQIHELLNQMNEMDRRHRMEGGSGLAQYVNANQLIPREIVRAVEKRFKVL